MTDATGRAAVCRTQSSHASGAAGGTARSGIGPTPGVRAARRQAALGSVGAVLAAVILLAVVALVAAIVAVWALAARRRVDGQLTVARAEATAAAERVQALEPLTAEVAEATDRVAALAGDLDAASARARRLEDEIAQARAELAASRATGVSPITETLWAMEQRRSRRTWRQGWAPGSPEPMPFQRAADALGDALRAEALAARETAGLVIEIDAALPEHPLDADASLLVLRCAQELLAEIPAEAETTTLVVRTGHDRVELHLHAIDERGATLPWAVPDLAASAFVEALADGVVIHTGVSPHEASASGTT